MFLKKIIKISMFFLFYSLINFSVPFLSYLAILLLFGATVVLYYVPIRYLIMGWGINKFTRKILRPNTIPNNELLDLISRVPDNEEKVNRFLLFGVEKSQFRKRYDHSLVDHNCTTLESQLQYYNSVAARGQVCTIVRLRSLTKNM